MATEVTIKGQRAKKGAKMTMGKGWKLVTSRGRIRVFSGRLLGTFNLANRRIAVFNVPK